MVGRLMKTAEGMQFSLTGKLLGHVNRITVMVSDPETTHEGHRADFTAASRGSLADTMAKGYRPSVVPLLPLIINKKEDKHPRDSNDGINQNS